jgi:capsular polysaccharide biosynthesis protein
MDALGDMGFQAFVLEEMSVAAQAALFSSADVVVAPHGAGLTNIIYADDLQVVELFGNVRPHYYRLATMLDFEYSYVLCEKRGPDIVAEPADLRRALARYS